MLGLKNLVETGSITSEMAEDLGNLVIGGANLVIVGNSGSGKTSLLNTLSNLIPRDERVIIIEEESELTFSSSFAPLRFALKKNIRPDFDFTNPDNTRIRIASSLRMRPNWIIFGEVRDAAAYDILRAMNTGHNGMTTIHASGVNQGIDRLINLISERTEAKEGAILTLIAEAVNIMVVVERDPETGFRRVSSITEISPRKDAAYGEANLAVSTLWEFDGETSTQLNNLSKDLRGRLQLDDKKRYTLEELYKAEEE